MWGSILPASREDKNKKVVGENSPTTPLTCQTNHSNYKGSPIPSIQSHVSRAPNILPAIRVSLAIASFPGNGPVDSIL